MVFVFVFLGVGITVAVDVCDCIKEYEFGNVADILGMLIGDCL
jgi:hypothetical protein